MQAMLCSESFGYCWGLTLHFSENEEEEERERLRKCSSDQAWGTGYRYLQAMGKLDSVGGTAPVH